MIKRKVAVIIPCHNDGVLLKEALKSVQEQTYQDINIIIVNDHSTDLETLRILNTLCLGSLENNIVIVNVPEGKTGLSAARNTALKYVDSIYVLPLDADDLIHKTFIEKAVTILDADPETKICGSWTKYFGLKHSIYRPETYSLEKFILRQCNFPVTCLFRLKDWEKCGGYDESLKFAEDFSFWLSLLQSGGKVHFIEETLFFCRIRKNSMQALAHKNDLYYVTFFHIIKTHLELYKQFATKFALDYYVKKEIENQYTCLFSYKAMNFLIKFEFYMRWLIKKFLGRI